MSEISFRTCEEVRSLLKKTCEENSEVADFQELGSSEEGRPIVAAVLGNGPKTVCLVAGAHSDEPVGPEMLRTFIFQTLAQKERFTNLFSEFRFIIVPHINPDGEAKNQPWIKKWPNVEDYLRHAFRELPGRDLEFGYPDMRKENEVVADLRDIFDAPDRGEADRRLERAVEKYAESAPKLADWMEANVSESLTVLCLPPRHRVRMRTSNMLERLNRELKRRTRVVSIFPNEASLLRLASAVLMETDEGWMSGRKYLTMETN